MHLININGFLQYLDENHKYYKHSAFSEHFIGNICIVASLRCHADVYFFYLFIFNFWNQVY